MLRAIPAASANLRTFMVEASWDVTKEKISKMNFISNILMFHLLISLHSVTIIYLFYIEMIEIIFLKKNKKLI